MDKTEIYLQVAAALFAAYRTDQFKTTVEHDVSRTIEDAKKMVDGIVASLAEDENKPETPLPPEEEEEA